MAGDSVWVQIIAADCAGVLGMINQKQVCVSNVRFVDGLTTSFCIYERDLKTVHAIVRRCGGELSVLKGSGTGKLLRSLLSRPILLFGVLLVFLVTLFLPTRIFFVRVEGNIKIPERLILEHAEQCGIGFGALRRDVRSEQVKNRLLQVLPQLQWLGVNTYGCTAVISVRERAEEITTQNNNTVSSIVAVRDGIIESCTATRGTLLCKPGQAVKAGQTLISGYTDCGLTIRAERSEGEVYAQTVRKMRVIVPTDWDKYGEVTMETKKYSLIIGKNRINFYKDSGILGMTCDKMYTEYVLTLPGGFHLPLRLLVQTQTYRDVQAANTLQKNVSDIAHQAAQDHLLRQMIGGTILKNQFTEEDKNGVYILTGEFYCSEMIGRIRSEENIQSNGKDY